MALKALLQDAGWYGLAKGSAGVAALLQVALLLDWLGSADYAGVSIGLAAAFALAQFGGGWLYHGLMRFGASGNLPLAQAGICLALSTLAALPFVLGIAVHPRTGALAVAVSLLGLAVGGYTLLLGVLQSRRQAREVTLIEALRAFAALALLLIGQAMGLPATPAVALGLLALSYVAALLIAWERARRAVAALPADAQPEASRTTHRWQSLLRYGAPLAIWMGGYSLLAVADRLVLSRFHGESVAGHYAALGDLLVRGLGLLLFPLVLAAHGLAVQAVDAGTWAHARTLLRQTLLLQVALCAVVLPLVVGVLPAVLQRWQPGLVSDRWVLGLIALAAMIWQAALLLQKIFELRERTLQLVGLLAAAALVQVVLLLAWVPAGGMRGTAAAGVATATFYALGITVLLARRGASP